MWGSAADAGKHMPMQAESSAAAEGQSEMVFVPCEQFEGREMSPEVKWYRKGWAVSLRLLGIGAIMGAMGVLLAPARQPQPNVRHKLEVGLNTVAEWFPEDAPMLLQNKEEILDHLMNKSTPGSNSPLRRLASVQTMGTMDFNLERFRMQPMTQAHGDGRRLTVESPACVKSLSILFVDLFKFVSHMVGIAIPAQNAFQDGLETWLTANLDNMQKKQLVTQIHGLVQAQGHHKIWAMWVVICAVWSAIGPFKLLFFWLKTHGVDTWAWIKGVVIMAAQLAIWFATNKHEAFVGDAVLAVGQGDNVYLDALHTEQVCRFLN